MALILNNMIERETLFWANAVNPWHRSVFWGICVGLNEEFAKWLVLLLVFRPFRTLVISHAILAAVAVAVGFAVIENLFYLQRFGTPVLLMRSVLTVPAHALFSIPLGIGIAISAQKVHWRTKYLMMLLGLLVAALLHGGYDLLLSIRGLDTRLFAYLYLFLLAAGIYGFVLWQRSSPSSQTALP